MWFWHTLVLPFDPIGCTASKDSPLPSICQLNKDFYCSFFEMGLWFKGLDGWLNELETRLEVRHGLESTRIQQSRIIMCGEDNNVFVCGFVFTKGAGLYEFFLSIPTHYSCHPNQEKSCFFFLFLKILSSTAFSNSSPPKPPFCLF